MHDGAFGLEVRSPFGPNALLPSQARSAFRIRLRGIVLQIPGAVNGGAYRYYTLPVLQAIGSQHQLDTSICTAAADIEDHRAILPNPAGMTVESAVV